MVSKFLSRVWRTRKSFSLSLNYSILGNAGSCSEGFLHVAHAGCCRRWDEGALTEQSHVGCDVHCCLQFTEGEVNFWSVWSQKCNRQAAVLSHTEGFIWPCMLLPAVAFVTWPVSQVPTCRYCPSLFPWHPTDFSANQFLWASGGGFHLSLFL